MTINLDGVAWRKASYSGSGGNCVEVAITPNTVGARDSKHPAARLELSRQAWNALIEYIK